MRDTRFDERLGRESERARARAKEPRKKQRESTYAACDEGRRLRVPAGDGEVVVAVQRLHFARFAVLSATAGPRARTHANPLREMSRFFSEFERTRADSSSGIEEANARTRRGISWARA